MGSGSDAITGAIGPTAVRADNNYYDKLDKDSE